MKAALRIGAVATGAALALGSAGSAYAATPRATSAAQNLATSRIEGRLNTLHALSQAVEDSKYLTPTERATLGRQISTDISGLTTLKSNVADATTTPAVRTDEVSMVDNYRVYLLMAPQTRLTEALAAESDAASTLQKADAALSDLLTKQSGGGTAEQKSELADLQSQITAAQAAIGNEVTSVLAIQPGPNANAITSALAPAKSAVKTARADLLKARSDAKALRASL